MPSIDDLQGVYSTSELRQMCESGRGVFNLAADRLSVTAAELNLLLRAIPGNPLLLGLDSRAVAKRITKHLVRASHLQVEAARSMKDCWFTYEGLILNPTQPAGRPSFNVKG
jgi:hypothetical protein